MKKEIDAYEKLHWADVELDPLKWWRVHASTYLSWLCLPRNIYAFQHQFPHQKGYLAHQVTLRPRNKVA